MVSPQPHGSEARQDHGKGRRDDDQHVHQVTPGSPVPLQQNVEGAIAAVLGLGGAHGQDPAAVGRFVEPAGKLGTQHAAAFFQRRALALARDHEDAAAAPVVSLGEEAVECGMGLALGHAMEIVACIDRKLAAPEALGTGPSWLS